MLENHAFCDWSRSSTLSCCSCCKLQCCSILLLPLIMMQSYRQSEFSAISVSRIPANPARRVTPTWNVYRAKFDPGWEGYPEWQTGLPALAGHPTYHVHEIKLKGEIIWTGGLPHLETFTWKIVTPAERVTRSGRPGYPPWRVTPPITVSYTHLTLPTKRIV